MTHLRTQWFKKQMFQFALCLMNQVGIFWFLGCAENREYHHQNHGRLIQCQFPKGVDLLEHVNHWIGQGSEWIGLWFWCPIQEFQSIVNQFFGFQHNMNLNRTLWFRGRLSTESTPHWDKNQLFIQKCEFCEKWDFRIVNFVKNEISEMWILSKMGFQKCEFCKNWKNLDVNFG